jgi:hypothetical protein
VLAFTTDELARRFRSDVDDAITDVGGSDADCLWSDYDVYGYMTEACAALASAAAGVYRTIRLPFAAGAASVRLPPYVLHVREAALASDGRRVYQANASDRGRAVDTDATGAPAVYVRDLDPRVLYLYPTPVVPDAIELQCTVSITTPLDGGVPLPFMDVTDQRLLLHYMKSLAYRKHDAETEDLTRAREFERLWKEGSLDRRSELNNYRRHPPVMRAEVW